ncbi:AAA family ATPase [Bradyrhizobium sp. S3.9.1]|uniref:AAA family ATPase n=1 Tax=Bradyrhizobium sp. S3.9.1 TaxID=3156431 RepID=UPI003394BDC2
MMRVQVSRLKPVDEMEGHEAQAEFALFKDALRGKPPEKAAELLCKFAARFTEMQAVGFLPGTRDHRGNPTNWLEECIYDAATELGLAEQFQERRWARMLHSALSGEDGGITASRYAWKPPECIEQRDWLYGKFLLRKFLSAAVAPGGVGKSSLIVAEALAQVSGKSLLGVTPPKQLRVWLWNLEDPQEETERKIQAAAIHYCLSPDDIGDRLFVDSGRDQQLVIASADRNGVTIAHPVVDALVAEIRKYQIDIIVIDPFVSCHKVPENDNGAQDDVVKEWGRVADRGNCAVLLVDHTRKMGDEAEVTTESARGAKSKTDGCRSVRVLNRMTKAEAEKAGVENHRLYFRAYDDKPNLAPPSEKSEWFKLVSVPLGNGHLGGPGDEVGVVTCWEWPDLLAGVTGADFDKAARVIKGGTWRADAQSPSWVGKAIANALELNLALPTDKAKVKALLRSWRDSGALVEVEELDEKRKPRKFTVVREDEEMAA